VTGADAPRLLVLAWGNPSRGDDALGPAFADAVEKLALEHVTVEADFQLSPEHAHLVARHRYVLFVDAASAGAEPFTLSRVLPGGRWSFSSHTCGPDAVLALSETLFNARPEAAMLAIRGHEFQGLGEPLSAAARRNLASAFEFLRPLLRPECFGGIMVRANGMCPTQGD